MVAGIALGRKGSKGIPNKNLMEIQGRPIAEWVMSKMVKTCDECYISTDCPDLMSIAGHVGVNVIKRPPELCTDNALSFDAFVHAYNEIKGGLAETDLVAHFFCNAPTFTTDHVRKAVDAVRGGCDCAVTVSPYNMFAPVRAWQMAGGELEPWPGIDLAACSCDRDSAGDAWFYDAGVAVMNKWCLDNMDKHDPPHKWVGGKVCGIPNEAGLDIDKPWQRGQLEWWAQTYGMDT